MQHKNRSGFTAVLIIVVAMLLVMTVGGFLYINTAQKRTDHKSAERGSAVTVLSPELESILSKKIILVEALAQNPALVDALKSSAQVDGQLTKDEITKLDDEWKKSEGDSDFSKKFLANETAILLKKFQEDNPGFPEVFVTNSLGLNVGQTNKTSDYLQSDEQWWTGAYAEGLGNSYHGDIEYDESAQSRSVALYVPVYNGEKQVVGIIKAVLDIAAIQQEL